MPAQPARESGPSDGLGECRPPKVAAQMSCAFNSHQMVSFSVDFAEEHGPAAQGWSVECVSHSPHHLGVRLPTKFRFGSMAQAMVRMEHQSAQGSLLLHSLAQISPQNTCCGLGGVVAQIFLSLDGQHLMCLDSSSGAVLGYQAWWLDGS